MSQPQYGHAQPRAGEQPPGCAASPPRPEPPSPGSPPHHLIIHIYTATGCAPSPPQTCPAPAPPRQFLGDSRQASTWLRAVSTASSASQPYRCVREWGLPYCSVMKGSMASTTRGSMGVVACMQRRGCMYVEGGSGVAKGCVLPVQKSGCRQHTGTGGTPPHRAPPHQALSKATPACLSTWVLRAAGCPSSQCTRLRSHLQHRRAGEQAGWAAVRAGGRQLPPLVDPTTAQLRGRDSSASDRCVWVSWPGWRPQEPAPCRSRNQCPHLPASWAIAGSAAAAENPRRAPTAAGAYEESARRPALCRWASMTAWTLAAS